MNSLSRHQSVISLAISLGLSTQGDCLLRIRDYALARVEEILDDFNRYAAEFSVKNFNDLRRLISNKLSLKIEWIRSDEDIERISSEYRKFHPSIRGCLRHEFIQSSTEGITIPLENPIPGAFKFLAVIDARGERASRAYFTTWHEIVHLLLDTAEYDHSSYRHTIVQENSHGDPLEKVVDYVTEHVAFYAPFFEPVLRLKIEEYGRLTFHAIEEARLAIVAEASLLATANRSIHHIGKPALLMEVYSGLKKAEIATSQNCQQNMSNPPLPKLRVRYTKLNDFAKRNSFAIRNNMRVPLTSVLARAYESKVDECYEAVEDQSWWETSSTGSLPSLPLWVTAVRRGRYVYGIITVHE